MRARCFCGKGGYIYVDLCSQHETHLCFGLLSGAHARHQCYLKSIMQLLIHSLLCPLQTRVSDWVTWHGFHGQDFIFAPSMLVLLRGRSFNPDIERHAERRAQDSLQKVWCLDHSTVAPQCHLELSKHHWQARNTRARIDDDTSGRGRFTRIYTTGSTSPISRTKHCKNSMEAH